MGLLDQIRRDVNHILTSKATAPMSDVVFTTPIDVEPEVSVTCVALAVKHSIPLYKSNYQETNIVTAVGRTARVTVSEAALVALDYPVRNGDNVVDMKDHKVQWVDSAGLTYTGIIRMQEPDETTGNIVFTVGDHAS